MKEIQKRLIHREPTKKVKEFLKSVFESDQEFEEWTELLNKGMKGVSCEVFIANLGKHLPGNSETAAMWKQVQEII